MSATRVTSLCFHSYCHCYLQSPHLGSVLDLLRDPEHLWSPYGLRSLSASHPEFGTGENYWRGPIWIQMNYLALQALHEVSTRHDTENCYADGIFLIDLCCA